MGGFTLYPAIDIRDGRCVRLVQGDYDRETIYGDPAGMAERWRSEGATWLHVVDLDGAREGRPVNLPVVKKIIAAVDIPIQLGGGLRRREDLETVLEMGVARAIVGTVAAEDPEALRRLVEGLRERIAVGVDLRAGVPQVRGWKAEGKLKLTDLLAALEAAGILRVIHTEIERDGMLGGYDVDALRAVASATRMAVIASGGVSAVSDILAIKKLMRLGVEGAILGKALYAGDLELAEALALQEE